VDAVVAENLTNEPRGPAVRDGARRSLRVLLVVESSAGGTGRHVLDLAEGLTARGCEVHVIYSTTRVDRLFLDRLARLDRVRHVALPIRTSPHPADLSVVRAVRRHLREFGPFDVVHGHSSKGGAIARLASFGTGAAAFYTLHGLIMMDPLLPRWKWLMYLSIELALATWTSRVIAVSPEEQRAAVKLGFGRSRVILVPNGIGEMGLTPRPQARRVMGVDDEAIVIGFVGRLVEQKAPEVLIEAFAATAKVEAKARLALVGSGPLEGAMRELAARRGVADKIIWLGERDARGVLAGFDLFALASRKEGLPYVVLEAMAAGLPVVATTSAGSEILVIPGLNGAVVPADDPHAFGKALIDLVTDPAKRAKCGAASLQRVAHFSIDAMVDATLAAYREACGAALAGCTCRLESLHHNGVASAEADSRSGGVLIPSSGTPGEGGCATTEVRM
jgi:glycosyltransferase involved in cell wall biosynthesis